MEVWAQGNDYLFFSLFSDYIFLLGLEHGFVGMGAWGLECGIFSELFISKIIFCPVIKMVYLFTLELKHGRGE